VDAVVHLAYKRSGGFRGERGLDAFEVELDNVRMAGTACRAA